MTVSTITIGRLFNLGNFEHIRYEISIEVGDSNPGEALTRLESIINSLESKSPVQAYELDQAKKVLTKPASELNAFERSELDSFKATVAKHEAWNQARLAAREDLGRLAGTAKFTDHKDTWDQNQ